MWDKNMFLKGWILYGLGDLGLDLLWMGLLPKKCALRSCLMVPWEQNVCQARWHHPLVALGAGQGRNGAAISGNSCFLNTNGGLWVRAALLLWWRSRGCSQSIPLGGKGTENLSDWRGNTFPFCLPGLKTPTVYSPVLVVCVVANVQSRGSSAQPGWVIYRAGREPKFPLLPWAQAPRAVPDSSVSSEQSFGVTLTGMNPGQGCRQHPEILSSPPWGWTVAIPALRSRFCPSALPGTSPAAPLEPRSQLGQDWFHRGIPRQCGHQCFRSGPLGVPEEQHNFCAPFRARELCFCSCKSCWEPSEEAQP